MTNEFFKINRIAIIAVSTILLACAAGPPAPKVPAHERSSHRALGKGVDLYQRGCYRKALVWLQEAHERYTAADDRRNAANSLNTMANVYQQMGETDSALAIIDDAISLYRSDKDTLGTAQAMINKAAILIDADRPDQAQRILDQPATVEDQPDRIQFARLRTMAVLSIHRHQYDQADRRLAQAAALLPDKDPSASAALHFTWGHLKRLAHQWPLARGHFQAALEADRLIPAYAGIAADLAALASCHQAEGRSEEAAVLLKQSAKIYALLGNEAAAGRTLARAETESKSGAGLRATRHWVDRWIGGQARANLCR